MTSSSTRPDPERLLSRIAEDERREHRAKLKIFFGFAPGVGKTYAMLESAQRALRDGVDVVVGCVETHGRSDTVKLTAGLPTIDDRNVEYRGTVLHEFDLDAAVRRKPKLLLLDELAHTNAPDSRHEKRWQDVLDLLDAGIDVHTTLNVQHVESLNDVVAQVTSVRVRETVPDRILERADEIELVDLPPDELLARLREGKVYVPEQASRAAESFFRRGNLLALRELALRRVAERVDADVLAYRNAHAIAATWPTNERVLVCVGPSPGSATLVRSCFRIASFLKAPWIAAYVEGVTTPPLVASDRERLEANLRLAESLGAQVVRLSGERISTALLEYARKANVTRIVLGKPTHPRLRDRLRGSLLDDVVRGSGTVDVHVIAGEGDVSPRESRPISHSAQLRIGEYAASSALIAAVTGLAHTFHARLSLPDVVMLYLLTIMLASARFGMGPSMLASALSVAAYDFFFIPPFFTFAVTDIRHVLTFFVMFVVGVVISGLTSRLRKQEAAALSREERTATLYALTRELSGAALESEIAAIVAHSAAQAFGAPVVVLNVDEHGALVTLATSENAALTSDEESVVRWAYEHREPAGRGTNTLPGARVVAVPLVLRNSVNGVLALRVSADAKALHAEQRHFLDVFARQAALALERAHLAEEAKTAQLRVKAEEMRSALLGAVSHDLRTPLAAITGAATALIDPVAQVSAERRQDLLVAICEEAERLERLVSNLLEMTRLESGQVVLRREWVPVEEIVGAAITRLEVKLSSRVITTSVPADLPLLFVDAVLLGQLLINLLENASKYTPQDSTIDIRAFEDTQNLVIEVADHGPGLRPGVENLVFEKFYRGAHVGIGGVGLGLSICRAIADAHGGRLVASNAATGGAVFRLELPLSKELPPAFEEPALARDSTNE